MRDLVGIIVVYYVVLFDYCFIISTVICQKQHPDLTIAFVQIQWELKDFIILNTIEEPQ